MATTREPAERVLVTGATGQIGPRVVWRLHRAGYLVRALSRRPPPPGLLPAGVELLSADIADPGAVARALAGVHAVVHLAALLHITEPPSAIGFDYERTNVHGTQVLVEAAVRAGVSRLVHFSSITVYGSNAGVPLTEESAVRPDTPYAQSKAEAERVVLAARTAAGVPLGVVLRLGAVYGGRVKGNYRRLAVALANGRFVPVGRGLNRRALLHEWDAAEAACLALQKAPAGRIYNVSDGEQHTVADIIASICAALGRRPPRVHIPVEPVSTAVAVLEVIAGAIGRPAPIGRATIAKYTEDVVLDATRIRRELGFAPHFDLRTGWAQAIAEMRHQGVL